MSAPPLFLTGHAMSGLFVALADCTTGPYHSRSCFPGHLVTLVTIWHPVVTQIPLQHLQGTVDPPIPRASLIGPPAILLHHPGQLCLRSEAECDRLPWHEGIAGDGLALVLIVERAGRPPWWCWLLWCGVLWWCGALLPPAQVITSYTYTYTYRWISASASAPSGPPPMLSAPTRGSWSQIRAWA